MCRSNPNLGGRREGEGERERPVAVIGLVRREGEGEQDSTVALSAVYIRTVWERSFEDMQKVFGN